jgi:excisionase family DNA binding protein
MESMMTARQVAELLGVHENWVYDQAACGKLPSYKIGGSRRFDPDELRSWIAEHRQSENGRQPLRRSAGQALVTAAARRDVQHEEPQPEAAHSARVRAQPESEAGCADGGPQPQLFEI